LQERCALRLKVAISLYVLWYHLERLGLILKSNWRAATGNLSSPSGMCGSWRLLYRRENEHVCVPQHYHYGDALGISLPFPKVCKARWDIVFNDSNRRTSASGYDLVD